MKYDKKFLTITIVLILILAGVSAATIKYLSFMENETLKKITSMENKILQAMTSAENETLKEMSLKAMDDITNKDNEYLLMNCTGTALSNSLKKDDDIFSEGGEFIGLVDVQILEQTMSKALVQVTFESRDKGVPNTESNKFRSFTFEKVYGLWKISSIKYDV